MKNKRFAQIGSVSSDTMREEDLIPAFIYELQSLGCTDERLDEIDRACEKEGYFESEECLWDLNETLFDLLNEYAPPYCYFGAHVGDGADYGFWVSFDAITDDVHFGELLQVNDTSEIPSNHRGYVVHVNDHGNTTLYNKTARKLTEVWGVV